MLLIALSTVRNPAVWDFQCGMHEWSQRSTTGWAFWYSNYCSEWSRFAAEVTSSLSRDRGGWVSRENVIHLAEWLHSCSGHNMTLWDNRRSVKSNSFSVVFNNCWKCLKEMTNGVTCNELSVIILHFKLINESPFHFGLCSTLFFYCRWDSDYFTAVYHQRALKKICQTSFVF